MAHDGTNSAIKWKLLMLFSSRKKRPLNRYFSINSKNSSGVKFEEDGINSGWNIESISTYKVVCSFRILMNWKPYMLCIPYINWTYIYKGFWQSSLGNIILVYRSQVRHSMCCLFLDSHCFCFAPHPCYHHPYPSCHALYPCPCMGWL